VSSIADMLGLNVRIEDGGTPAQLREMAKVLDNPAPALRDFAGHVVRRIKLSFVRAEKMEAAPAGEPPRAHTRGFSKSIAFDMRGDRAVAIGSSDVRADLLQHGGVIRPVRAGALTIPMIPEAYGKRARDFAGLVMVPGVGGWSGTGGKARLVRVRKGRGGMSTTTQTVFLLLKQVTIKPHPWLGITDEDWRYFEEALARRLDKESAGPAPVAEGAGT